MTVEPRLTRNWSNPDAVGIDGYVAAGGYAGLRTAVTMSDAEQQPTSGPYPCRISAHAKHATPTSVNTAEANEAERGANGTASNTPGSG